LNSCQENRLDGYICIDTLVQLSRMLDRKRFALALPILSKLLTPIGVNLRDLREAMAYQNMEKGLEIVLTYRHRLNCLVVKQKNLYDNSTIKLCVPKELKRMLEDGKTD
ncbi:MAG: hypothetical protein J5946_06440, partial [Erysipelotrichaceae bacterium]|nr:hypothetical protein [Erysipelotrichaceae bacterium]